MIKVENIDVFNFENAIRGMRNALESWNKSDSKWDLASLNYIEYVIGENDLKLMKKLILAGSSHRKFMRQILVSMDITAPLYWFKEFDTYKVGTVSNSTSTMHKLMDKPITLDCFAFDAYTEATMPLNLIEELENMRKAYIKETNKTKKTLIWRALIQLLPCAWLQTRTCTMNYEVLRSMYFDRKNHKLIEWSEFCEVINELPYSELITIEKGNDSWE